MKKLTPGLAVLLLGITIQAQEVKLVSTWTAMTGEGERPARWIETSAKSIENVFVKGHWKALDKNNPVAGFSVSEISCSKLPTQGERAQCTEEAASIVPVAGWQVLPEHHEYIVSSWRPDGLTARYASGSCGISHTLEIDFNTGSVLVTDSPTKITGIKACDLPASTYQLMDGEGFSIVKSIAAKSK